MSNVKDGDGIKRTSGALFAAWIVDVSESWLIPVGCSPQLPPAGGRIEPKECCAETRDYKKSSEN